MAALLAAALLTCGCADTGRQPSAADEGPERMLSGARTSLVVEGVVRARIDADSAIVNAGEDTATLFGVRAVLLGPDAAEVGELSAAVVAFDMAAQVLAARDGAEITVRATGQRIAAAEMRLDARADSIWSDTETTLSGGGAQRRVPGFSSDFRLRRVTPRTASG